MALPKTTFQEFPCLINVDSQEVLRLNDDRTLLGRKDGSFTFPDDKKMSSEHLMIINKGGTVYIEDLETTNGTYHNGNRIGTGPVKIKNNDVFSVGHQTFKVHIPKGLQDSGLATFTFEKREVDNNLRTHRKTRPNQSKAPRPINNDNNIEFKEDHSDANKYLLILTILLGLIAARYFLRDFLTL